MKRHLQSRTRKRSGKWGPSVQHWRRYCSRGCAPWGLAIKQYQVQTLPLAPELDLSCPAWGQEAFGRPLLGRWFGFEKPGFVLGLGSGWGQMGRVPPLSGFHLLHPSTAEPWKVKSESRSVVSELFVTPWTIQCVEFSRPEYWSG